MLRREVNNLLLRFNKLKHTYKNKNLLKPIACKIKCKCCDGKRYVMCKCRKGKKDFCVNTDCDLCDFGGLICPNCDGTGNTQNISLY